MSVRHQLGSFGKFYINRVVLGATGAVAAESLLIKFLGQAKYVPFYTFYLIGSTVALVVGLTGFAFTGALIYFQGTSSFSDSGLLASSVLTVLGLGTKLMIFFYLRHKEKKARVFHDSLKALGTIAENFIEAFARELRREQGQMVNHVIQKHPEVLVALNSLQDSHHHDNHHLH